MSNLVPALAAWLKKKDMAEAPNLVFAAMKEIKKLKRNETRLKIAIMKAGEVLEKDPKLAASYIVDALTESPNDGSQRKA